MCGEGGGLMLGVVVRKLIWGSEGRRDIQKDGVQGEAGGRAMAMGYLDHGGEESTGGW